ncbi:MAG: hypothetical protein WCY49_00340 [Anaerovoracaceae bacterium]|nr:hypothetical protein [Clostridiales bacterium]
MKQIIVLVAMIALGIAIAGIISGFSKTAEDLGQGAISSIVDMGLPMESQ